MYHPSKFQITLLSIIKLLKLCKKQDLPMVRRIVYCIAICMNKVFYYYNSIHLGIIFRLSEKYLTNNGISEYYFRCVHRHLPIGMQYIEYECATHPRNCAYVISLVVSNKEIFFYIIETYYERTLIIYSNKTANFSV